jgi:hypothetical protein
VFKLEQNIAAMELEYAKKLKAKKRTVMQDEERQRIIGQRVRSSAPFFS